MSEQDVPLARGAHLAARLALLIGCGGIFVSSVRWLRSARIVRQLAASCRLHEDPRLQSLVAAVCAELGVGRAVPLAVSPLAPGPLTLGIRRPRIVLPAGLELLLDEAELRGVLAHEVAHVARRDALANLLQRIVQVLYWWNPLLQALQRGIRRTREQLCDDCVLSVQGDGLPLAGALVKVATWMVEIRPTFGATTLLDDEGELNQRMTRLIERRRSMSKRIGQIAAFTLGVCVTLALGFVFVPALAAENEPPAVKKPASKKPKPDTLSYHDGSADGKKSLGGNGEMISFTLPKESSKVRGVRIHGSRYGLPQPPKEDFMIYFLSQDQSETLATKTAPYSRFKRGAESWVEIKFPQPIELPKEFWVALDFRAEQTKGVYVSYDNSTDRAHSRIRVARHGKSPGQRGRRLDDRSPARRIVACSSAELHGARITRRWCRASGADRFATERARCPVPLQTAIAAAGTGAGRRHGRGEVA